MLNALVECIEGAESVRFDARRGEVLVNIAGQGTQPFANLSDGQRCMLAMVGDIAQKAVKLNPHLGTSVLAMSKGVVLVDELDLHLHPVWQRRVVADLKRTFPGLQFIATTHSPQIVGQVPPEELLLLKPDEPAQPSQSFGLDSNSVLKYLMGAQERDPEVKARLESVERAIIEGRYDDAKREVQSLRDELGETVEIVRYQARIQRWQGGSS